MSVKSIQLKWAALGLALLSALGAVAEEAKRRHEGVATCASSLCHGSSQPLKTYESALQNEYTTWSQFDPHSNAYKVLLNKQSQEIARRMGIGPAHEAPACLACHSDAVPAAQRGVKFQLDDGVGCESCHGGSEKWLATHYQVQKIPRSENLARGLVALENPDTLAGTCLACHVGDKERYANHRMMAAGHPRIVFELDTYLELWRTSGGREHYRKSAQIAHVALWAKGLIESSRRQLDLIDRHGAGRLGPIPDFGIYACHSCHRDLRLSAFGGSNSSLGGPGDLRWQDAHLLVLQQVSQALRLQSSKPLDRAIIGLQRSANGDVASLKLALASTRDALLVTERELKGRNWSTAEMNLVVQALIDASRRGGFPDPAAAEQAAMGLVVMLAGLQLDRGKRAEIDRLFDDLRDDNAFDQRRFVKWMSVLGAR
ncbi:MAG: multiheme c-type cytochrome [Gammaproteobacteria bacterium]